MVLFHSCADKITPQACVKGQYVAADDMSCADCPKGFYCPTDKLEYPFACANGTYQNQTGQQACLSCPAGHSCPKADVTPTECNTGLYSLLGVDECFVCPAGYR